MEALLTDGGDAHGEGAEGAGLAGQAALPPVCGCRGNGWMQDAYLSPANLCCLISDISKLELESDLTADLARTSLTKPSPMLVSGSATTRRGGCKAAAGSLAGKD